MKNIRRILITVVVVVILLVAGFWGWHYWQDLKDSGPGNGSSAINPEQYLVFEMKNDKVSDFQKEKFFERFTKAKNTIFENKAAGLEYKDDKNFYAWLEVASVQKILGDYDRAEAVWAWFTEAYPGNSISPANLGDLYKSFKVDKDKSEHYYQVALEREKKDFNIYYGLFELYRYNFNDSEKAIATLESGLANNPAEIKYAEEIIDYLVSLGDKDRALKVAQEFKKNNPASPDITYRIK